MIIAVDFDGTIVDDCYPSIGAEKPNAIAVLKKLQTENHKLILWTVREGEALENAINYCRSYGLEFYAVNANYPNEQIGDKHYSRKLKATLFIDYHTLEELPDWLEIYRLIQIRVEKRNKLREREDRNYKTVSFWKRFLEKFT